jgi:hypothetical protein
VDRNEEQRIAAAALTPRVRHWLSRNAAATVLHLSPHTCNLVDDQGDILSLVTPDIGRGPFAMVLPVSSFKFQVSGSRVKVSSSEFRVSSSPPAINRSHSQFTIHSSPFTITHFPALSLPPYLITTNEAELWEPRPQWDTIRPHLQRALPWLRLALLRHTPTHAPAIHQLPRFTAGIQTLCQCLIRQDETGITDATETLAGFGPGLTPAGDDGMMGVMYGLWATQAQPDEPLLGRVVEWARSRTTTLSGAFLAAAAAGEAVQAWHEMVRAIGEGSGEGVYAAAKGILAIGDSSGACALAGFITMAEVSAH